MQLHNIHNSLFTSTIFQLYNYTLPPKILLSIILESLFTPSTRIEGVSFIKLNAYDYFKKIPIEENSI